MSRLNNHFTAELQKSSSKGGWTYVVWPESVNFFKTRGLVSASDLIHSGITSITLKKPAKVLR